MLTDAGQVVGDDGSRGAEKSRRRQGVNHGLDAVKAECPSQTEVVIKGICKQAVGQVAAEIRAYRPPEPYKGKGVRYSDERVVMKEAKKK